MKCPVFGHNLYKKHIKCFIIKYIRIYLRKYTVLIKMFSIFVNYFFRLTASVTHFKNWYSMLENFFLSISEEKNVPKQIFCARDKRSKLKELGIILLAKPHGRFPAMSIHVSQGERNPIEGKFGKASQHTA